MVTKMSKKPCFRGPLQRQRGGKWIETLLQSEWLHLCNIYETLLRYVRSKKPFLVIHNILRLFVKTFTADGKHYLLNRDNFGQRIQMQFSQKQKTFSQFFFCISKIYIKL